MPNICLMTDNPCREKFLCVVFSELSIDIQIVSWIQI